MNKPVLDMTAGSRMMWFNHDDSRALFSDQRKESAELCDGRTLTVSPNIQSDFRQLPFRDNTFYHVIFDPPHIDNLGPRSWTRAKYGALFPTWRDGIADGFAEAFRVLRPFGTLIFKWNETKIPVTEVLALTPNKPLYGHRSGKASKTHWISFIKEDTAQ